MNRRNFLRKLGLGALALFSIGLLPKKKYADGGIVKMPRLDHSCDGVNSSFPMGVQVIENPWLVEEDALYGVQLKDRYVLVVHPKYRERYLDNHVHKVS